MYEFSHRRWPFDAGTFDRSLGLLRWCSFWAAIFLPVLHVPLLVVAGLTSSSLPALVALWAANAAALVVGRQHSPHGGARLGGGDDR